ncbi:thioredoxin family protein [Roseovarius sp.]|jgi:hypothetical protein
MIARLVATILACLWLVQAAAAQTIELVMVEQAGCYHCTEWKKTIGPIYPKTPEGAYAPLRMVSRADAPPPDVTFARPVNFTPTFILVENGQELARIEGHPGEDFFWGLLDMMLRQNTDFADPVKTN